MNNTVKLKIPNICISEVKYIFDILLNKFLGVDVVYETLDDGTRGCFKILYNSKSIEISNNFFTTANLYSKDRLPQSVYKDNVHIDNNVYPIVSLFGRINVSTEEDRIILECDIVSTAFFMLTRWEERVIEDRDAHNRFPSKSSMAFRNNFLDRPIVNEIVDLLWALLTSIGYKGRRKIFDYKVVPTHDVDRPYFWISKRKSVKSIVGRIKSKNLKDSWLLSKSFLDRKDPFDTHDDLMNRSEKEGVLSHFFFMTGGNSRYDNFYDIHHPRVKSLVKSIKDRGHIVGLHPSYNTFDDRSMLLKEKEELERVAEQEIICGRHHYLRMQMPKTLEIWSDIGMKWDSTLSYADNSGFRCGVCYPFPVFSIERRETLNLIERPLIVMEGSVATYENLSPKQAIEKSRKLKNEVKKHNGEFVFLWHNSSTYTSVWNNYSILLNELYSY